MTKEDLLKELALETYVALRPSAVHGIGVFAITDITRGCRDMFSNKGDNWIKLPFPDVDKLPQHSKELIETYCLYDNGNYFVPDYGFKLMDLVNYLNHSSSPNIKSVNDGEYFEAITDIPAGTELLINYGEIAEVEGYE